MSDEAATTQSSNSPPSPSHSLEYRPAIDGLRALAVLSVFVFHLNHRWLPGGFVGVDVFFVISGYLITSIILKDCIEGKFSYLKFYQRRIARIFPIFFTVGLATIVAAYFIYTPMDFASAGANLMATSLSVINMKLMFQGNYFELSPDAQPYMHYWSLSVEEQFYVVFPVLFVLTFVFARRRQSLLLGILGVASLALCLWMTSRQPVYAFFLLPTRGWELMAGCLLAIFAHGSPGTGKERFSSWSAPLGLIIILVSFVMIHEGPTFPGLWAVLPVVGAVAVLMPAGKSAGFSEKLLALAPLVLIGRMSYSLYLWHWPVFSFVDYSMYNSSEVVRLPLKIGLACLLTVLSFYFIENPSRSYLNRRQSRWMAYGFMLVMVAFGVVLGLYIRKTNHVNAELGDVAKGGLVFQPDSKKGHVILMGDSNGAMYGKVTKEIGEELGLKLNVLSVNGGGSPLPAVDGKHSQIWLDSLAVVKKEKPDCLILACMWIGGQHKDNIERLALAIKELQPHVGRLVILNQPPILPKDATREAIRNGRRPPFIEEAEHQRLRAEFNAFLKSACTGNCVVVDIASHFQEPGSGAVRFLDEFGRQNYADPTHLSGFGADAIKPVLQQAITSSLGTRRETPGR
ncbi:MAG: acyltransferase family protein [Gemmatales bacterium]